MFQDGNPALELMDYPLDVAKGKPKGRKIDLRLLGDDALGMRLKDRNGNQAMVAVTSAGPVLSVFNEIGKQGAGLSTAPNGNTALSINDMNGKQRAVLKVNTTGNPSLWMLDENGNPTWSAP